MTTAARPTRRILFTGLGALGVAAALAGCSGSDDDGDGDGDSGPGLESGAELTTTGDVPVGGGVILPDQQVVVTQPEEGTFKAFTSVCTHQQLQVTGVAEGQIQCDNHGSRFSVGDGAVEAGPAPSALAEVAITVEGDRILAA